MDIKFLKTDNQEWDVLLNSEKYGIMYTHNDKFKVKLNNGTTFKDNNLSNIKKLIAINNM